MQASFEATLGYLEIVIFDTGRPRYRSRKKIISGLVPVNEIYKILFPVMVHITLGRRIEF